MFFVLFILHSGIADEVRKSKVNHLSDEERIERKQFIRSELEKVLGRVATSVQAGTRYTAEQYSKDIQFIHFRELTNAGDMSGNDDLKHQLFKYALGPHAFSELGGGYRAQISRIRENAAGSALHRYTFQGVYWWDLTGWFWNQYTTFFIFGCILMMFWYSDVRNTGSEKKFPSPIMFVLACIAYPLSIGYVLGHWVWKFNEKLFRQVWFETELRRRKQQIFRPLSEREKIFLAHALEHFSFKQWVRELESLSEIRYHSFSCALGVTLFLMLIPRVSTQTLTYSTQTIIGSAVITQTVGEVHLARANIDDVPVLLSSPLVGHFILSLIKPYEPHVLWRKWYWYAVLLKRQRIPRDIDHIPRLNVRLV